MAWTGPGDVLDDPAVVFYGSRIAYAGPAIYAPVADDELVGDWFLMPAVVDHHVHIGLSDPRAILRGGVTAVRDLGWPPADVFPLVDISMGTDFEGPQVVAAGPMITAFDGYPSRASWAPAGTALEVRGPEAAAGAVEQIAGQDPVAVKVALNAEAGPTLSDPELVAICDTAHARSLSVVAHVQGKGQTERALGAGVDELAHCPWSERLGDELARAVARSMRIVPTLDIHSYGKATGELAVAVDNLRRFHGAGGRVLYGTDLGNGPIPPGIHRGEAAHLASAGLTADRILEAMTAWKLQAGARGDLVALGANPLEDIRALEDVRVVVRGGRVRRLEKG